MGYSQLLMSRIKSILKDSDSQWSLLTVTTTHHHRSPSTVKEKNRKKEIEKLSSLGTLRAYNIYYQYTYKQQNFIHKRDAKSN